MKISESSKQILTAPLKTWTDEQGRITYRLGDLPIDTRFNLVPGQAIYQVVAYSRSSHTGKRQCRNTATGKIEYINCTKKVYLVSE